MLCSWTDATEMGGTVFMANYNFEREGGAQVPAAPPPVPYGTRPAAGSGHGKGHELMGVVKNFFK